MSSIVPTVPRVSLSPAVKDWRTLRDEMFARVPQLTNRRWTDLNESEGGVVIGELLIGMVDVLLYYLDKQANEVTFVNATQRQNVINSLTLIGYQLRGYTAASGTVTIALAPTSGSPAFPISIPRGTMVSGTSETDDNVLFFTLTDAMISSPVPGAAGAATVPVLQGAPLQAPEVFSSDGTENQRYVLQTADLAKDLLTVKVGTTEASAVVWSPVESLISSRQTDKIYVPFLDAQGRAFIQFGDGKFGMVPPIGHNVYVYGVVVKGQTGNLAANTVTRMVSDITDAFGNPVRLTVNNAEAMTGGADPETIEEGKRQGPALFSGLYRAMSKADYIALTLSVPGVDKANAWGEQEELHPNVKLINRVTVAFLAKNSAGRVIDPSSPTYTADVAQLQTTIFDLLEEKKPITTRLVFQNPEWVDILVEALVAVDRTLYDPALVASEVRLAIQSFLSYDSVTFGQDARLSQLSRVISGVTGVSWAQVKLGRMTYTESGWVTQAPDYVDIPVAKQQLIRIADFDDNNVPVLGLVPETGQPREHILVTTTTNVDAPTPDVMANPCTGISQ